MMLGRVAYLQGVWLKYVLSIIGSDSLNFDSPLSSSDLVDTVMLQRYSCGPVEPRTGAHAAAGRGKGVPGRETGCSG